MPDFKSLADEQIRNAMEAGQFDNLPGQGKPLQLDDDYMVPEHLRLSHKILRDNDLAPDWIMDSKALELLHKKLLKSLRTAAQAYRIANGYQPAEAAWLSSKRAFLEAALAYNRKVMSYNLKVPPGVTHRAAIEIAREISRALDGA